MEMGEKSGWMRVLRGQEGVALLITLLVLFVLTAIVVEFDYGTRIQMAAAGNFRDDVRSTYLAKAGISAGQAILKWDNSSQNPNKNIYDGLDEFWANPIPSYPVGEGFVSAVIEDESAKLNINLLGDKIAAPLWINVWDRLVEDVLKIPNRDLVPAIIDWVDDNLDEEIGGAEESYYLGLDPPYEPRNGPMESLGEIHLIKGVTDEVFEKLMTGCGGGPCFTVAPTKAVNTNTVSLEVCMALHPELNEQFCSELISMRSDTPSTSPRGPHPPSWGGTGNEPSYDLGTKNMVTFESQFFSIQGTGEFNETKKSVLAFVERSAKNVNILRWQADFEMPGL